MKVVLCGPPRSGKSCLRQGLKDAMATIPGAPYCYVVTACPDGEGAWYQPTHARDPEEARRLKTAYKSRFTPEFVALKAEQVANCHLPMTLVDIGGIPDELNEMICAGATHAVILFKDQEELDEWRGFRQRVGLKVLAEIHSDYNGVEDSFQMQADGLLTGSVHHLERGEPVADRPTILALARHLLEHLEHNGPTAGNGR